MGKGVLSTVNIGGSDATAVANMVDVVRVRLIGDIDRGAVSAVALDVVVDADGLVAVAVTIDAPVVEAAAVAEIKMGGVAVTLGGVAKALVEEADAVGGAEGEKPVDAREGCTVNPRNRTTNRTRLDGRSRTSMRAFFPSLYRCRSHTAVRSRPLSIGRSRQHASRMVGMVLALY